MARDEDVDPSDRIAPAAAQLQQRHIGEELGAHLVQAHALA